MSRENNPASKENKPATSAPAERSGKTLDPASLASIKVKKGDRPTDLANPFDRLQSGAGAAGRRDDSTGKQ